MKVDSDSPVRFLRHTFAMWKFGGIGPWRTLQWSIAGFRRNSLDARSAQFAYYAMLMIAPTLILMIATIAQFPLDGVLESMLEGSGRALPADAHRVIQAQVSGIQEHSTVGLTVVSVAVLAFGGTKLFLTIVLGLNATYGFKRGRHLLRSYGVALLMSFAAFLLMFLALVLLVVGPMISQWLTAQVHLALPEFILAGGVRWSVALTTLLGTISMIYWIAPNVKLRWMPLAPGSVLATAGWVAICQGFRLYVENFAKFNETYGTLGGVIMLMVWLYLTGVVLFMGGQINSVIHRAIERNGISLIEIGTKTDATGDDDSEDNDSGDNPEEKISEDTQSHADEVPQGEKIERKAAEEQ